MRLASVAGSPAVSRRGGGGREADAARRKTILLPGGDKALTSFVAAESPVPVEVVSNPAAPLGDSDLAVLVVESVEPPLRAAVTRVLTDDVSYVVLVRRDVWSAASSAVHKLLDEVQRDPRRKLIRFWRDRDDLERTSARTSSPSTTPTLVVAVAARRRVRRGRLERSSRRGRSRTRASASGRTAS